MPGEEYWNSSMDNLGQQRQPRESQGEEGGLAPAAFSAESADCNSLGQRPRTEACEVFLALKARTIPASENLIG